MDSWITRRHRGADCPPLIDYILLAEFDIDTGSTLRHQYPSAIPGYKADRLAEYMLPEGVHNRDVDYTYIFLYRDGLHIDTSFWVHPAVASENEQSSGTSISNPNYFLYGLNVVKTKYDASARRGAIVKALCVFSRYAFVESLKKLLESALDDYYSSPGVDTLKTFYDKLNSVDLSSLSRPDYLEQLLMRRGSCYEQTMKTLSGHCPQDWIAHLPLPHDREMNLSIPLYYTPDQVGDINISLLVRIFGEATIRIYNAVVTKQRVLFVGHNHAACDIAQIVLSAVAMVAPPMTNIIRRTFPYATLSDLGFLEVCMWTHEV